MALTPVQTTIAGVHVVKTDKLKDARGSFSRLFCQNELSSLVGARQIVQINRSQTQSVGAVRGMHYQLPPYSEMKLIRCLRGRVFDVAVDLRAGSPTFLKWHAEELSEDNSFMLVVPEGCAHGFQVLDPGSELLYLHTSFYQPAFEGGIRFDDPRLAIEWPLQACDVSQRDLNHPLLKDDYEGIKL
ncbi:MAG: hypothetical protein ACD_39C00087G0002 [uncultured bacterium]|nr:MAG: hypothetical protein ACD_39C00087G0002 [uncultured bacterium]